MYFGNTVLVPIPKESDVGKVVVASTGYVYLQTGYEWDPVKKQPHYKRKTIGKKHPDYPELMYYSPDYEKFFGPVDREVAELKLRYGTRELKAAGKYNFSISYGPYAIIKAAAEKAGCLDPLRRAFPSDWRMILALCVHAIAEENTTSQAFPGWCFSNYCGLDRVPADTEISQLYKTIYQDRGNIYVFFSLYQKAYGQHFPAHKVRTVGFDSTNQNYGGKGIPWAKLGHAKIDVGLPIINTAMFVDEETGIPLWYENFDGSVLDKTQTPFSLKKAVSLGFQKLFVVFDRGYYSEDDILEMEALKDTEFGVLCPDGTTWVETLIRKKGPEIKDKQKFFIPEENVYGNRYEVHPFKDAGNNKTYYAYLFYDSERASYERDTIHEVIAYHWNCAKTRKRYSDKMAATYAPQGIIVVKADKDSTEDGKNFILLEDTAMIQELLDMKGYFVMISPSELLASEAIRIIRSRDASEKGFAMMMNHFRLRTTGRHTIETYTGMMFMAFVALICLSAFQYFEKEYLHAVSSRTTAVVFDEMAKYQILRNEKDGTWEPAYAMNKDQKLICQNVELTETEIQQQVATVKMKSKHSTSG